jgi:hypothetical protein
MHPLTLLVEEKGGSKHVRSGSEQGKSYAGREQSLGCHFQYCHVSSGLPLARQVTCLVRKVHSFSL